MTTFDTGRRAEQAAAAFLERKGCTIIACNWRTSRCEIDIVARRQTSLYFCEVKYRQTTAQGDGLDYITPAKLRQMHFAATCWLQVNFWPYQVQLCAIAVTGPGFQVTQAVKITV